MTIDLNESPSGCLIVLDGIDGCGKSTQCVLLEQYFRNKGYRVHLTREPTNTEFGQLLRKNLKDETIPTYIDALMFATDRAIHGLEIKKLLDKGYVVIADRYTLSSVMYQFVHGVFNGFGKYITRDWLWEINKFAYTPHILFFIDVDFEKAYERVTERNKGNKEDNEKFEYIEFLQNLSRSYKKFYNDYDDHLPNLVQYMFKIDGDQKVMDVHTDIIDCMTELDEELIKGKIKKMIKSDNISTVY
jgi:dTMP kinase